MNKLIWNYGGEGLTISAITAVVGTWLNLCLGGFDSMIKSLIVFMIMDLVLGVLAAAKNHNVNSNVMFWGGINKMLVLMLVGLGVLLDSSLGMNEPYVRTAIIWFYIGREGLSIIENYGKMGMPLPVFLTSMLEQLKGKGDKGEI